MKFKVGSSFEIGKRTYTILQNRLGVLTFKNNKTGKITIAKQSSLEGMIKVGKDTSSTRAAAILAGTDAILKRHK